MGILFLSGNAYAGNFWSDPFYYLAQGMDIGKYSAYFPYVHILLLSPVQAVLIGIALNIAYGFTMSGYYARYSLLGNSLFMYHNVHGEYEELLPSFVQSFLLNRRTITMYIVVIILLFAVTPGQKGVINILAGFSPQDSRGIR